MDGSTATFPLSEIGSVIAAVVIAVLWIEKRFKDSGKDAKSTVDEACRNEREARTSALNAATANNRAEAARFERMTAYLNNQNAELNRRLTEVQINHAKELRDYPTKTEMSDGFEALGERFDKFEARFDGFMGIKK
jgi:hypothetical protein